MKVSEKDIRRIVREEARKVLSEDIASAMQGDITVGGNELESLVSRLSTHMDERTAREIVLMWAGEAQRGNL